MIDLNNLESLIALFWFIIILTMYNSWRLAVLIYRLKFNFWKKLKYKMKRKNLVIFIIGLILFFLGWYFLTTREYMPTYSYLTIGLSIILSGYHVYQQLLRFKWAPWRVLLTRIGILKHVIAAFAAVFFTGVPILIIFYGIIS